MIAVIAVTPLVAVGFSPQLAWRDPIYIAAGVAGVAALSALLVQPLLAARLPVLGVSPRVANRLHRGVGTAIVCAVLAHVAGLYVTSPPDVIDVFTFRAPTAFSFWGLLAFWALLGAGLLAALRRRLRWRPRTWARVHAALAGTTLVGTIVHTLLIEGTMEPVTKVVLCAAVAAAFVLALWRIQIRA